MGGTKADIINNAYSQLRIRGVTVDATPEENILALNRLENMMNEFSGRGICVGYNFEDDPDAASDHNIYKKFWQAIESTLAARLVVDFGKTIPGELFAMANAGLSFLYSNTSDIPQIQKSSRMPIGSGNTIKRTYGLDRYYTPVETAPTSCDTHEMYVGDINDFQESFEDYIDTNSGESLSSYTIEATTGLTIVSDSQSGNIVSYQISAVGSDSDTVFKVIIVGTTSTGRVSTRVIFFNLTEVDV